MGSQCLPCVVAGMRNVSGCSLLQRCRLYESHKALKHVLTIKLISTVTDLKRELKCIIDTGPEG